MMMAISKTPTLEMSREDWLKERNRSIGGSDAAAILGLNTYRSAYALWAEKTGAVTPVDISDKEAVRLGNDLEQYVAERFAEATGKKVRRENNILRNDLYPFAHANPDRLIVGEKAGLECKTTSNWEIVKQLKDGKIPESWYCQMVHYMMVTGYDRWYLGALAFGHGFYWMTIERNEEEIAALAKAEAEFWELVKAGTPPAADGSASTTDVLSIIFRESAPDTSADLTAVGDHIELYNAICKQIKELTSAQEEHANAIKSFMGTAEKGSYGNTSISWKTSSRSTFDKNAYEMTFGKIPQQFYKTSQTRAFRVTVKEDA